MEPVTIEIAGVAYQLDPAVAAHIAGLEAQIAAMHGPPAGAEESANATAQAAAAAAAAARPAVPPAAAPAAPIKAGDEATLRAQRDAAIARADALEATVADRVAARVELVAKAAEVLDEVDAKATDHAIRAAVATAVFPGFREDLASNLAIASDPKASARDSAGAAGYLAAMFDSAVAAATTSGLSGLSARVDQARLAGAKKTDLDASIDAVIKAENDSNTRRIGALAR